MADEKDQIRELAEAAAQAQRDLAQFGRMTQQTQDQVTDAQMKAKLGINNFTAGTAKGADAVGHLANAAMGAGKAMLDGKKGAAALNSSLDSLSSAATAAGTALALMVPGGILIKGLIAGITMATTAYIKYTQAANEMADQLYKGYAGMAKAGGAAADGMTGLKRDAQKLGLAMGELDQLVSLVAENSKDFALFAGSVSDGRKKFADLGQAMTPAREGLMNLGMEVKDINEGMAGYVRLQTRLGNAQSMSVSQLAKGAEAYLKEQDALTKLTGQSRAEMEQQRERALQKEQFAAKVRELQLSGQKEAAENLLKLNSIYEAAGPETASAFQASVTGNLSNADAQKANLASQGEMIRSTQMVISGQISYQEAAQRTGQAMSATADTVGTTLGQLGVYNQNFGNLSEQIKLGQLAQGDIVANFNKIKEEQAKQLAGTDPLVKKQTELIQAQIAANQAMTDFIFKGIGNAQDAMITLANATRKAGGLLDKFTPGGSSITQQDVGNAGEAVGAIGLGVAGGLKGAAMGAMLGPIGAAVGAVIGSAAGVYLGGNAGKKIGELGADAAGIPKGSDGGLFSGPTSGYMAMLHGTEIVIPEDQLKGKISSGGIAGAGGEQLDRMNNLYKEMLKDTITLEKLTDNDLKRKQEYDRVATRLMDLQMEAMEDEINSLSSGGGQQSGGAGASGTSGSKFSFMSGGMNMPGMGGGQGLKGPEEHQAVGQGGQGLKGTPKLSTIRSKSGKSTSVNSEYAQRFQSLIDYLDSVGYEINSLGGYVDRDVRGKPGVKSVHAHGGAIDINPGANPMGGQLITDMPENISAIAKQLGLGWGGNWASVKDAMHFSVASNEGGDIKLSDGGVATGPNGGYPATLHGEEAVIPLNNGGGNFVKMFEAMAEGNSKMVAMMEEMVKAQKSSVDVQNKMLRAQS